MSSPQNMKGLDLTQLPLSARWAGLLGTSLVVHRRGDDGRGRCGVRVGLAQDPAAGQAVAVPQCGGPGADDGVDEIFAVFVVAVVQG